MDVFGRPPTRAENIAGFVMLLLITVLLALMLWTVTIVWSISENEWNHNKNRSSITMERLERLERLEKDRKDKE